MRALVLLFACAATTAGAQTDSTWRDYDRAQREARQRGDWTTALRHLRRLDALLGGHPSVVVAMARAQAQTRDTVAAVATLRRLATMGATHDVASDSLLAAVRATAAGAEIARALRANEAPAGAYDVVATLPAQDYVAEGVAWDASRNALLASSIRHRRVDVVTLGGTVTPLLDLARDGAWGALAVVPDAARDRLWVTTGWYPYLAGAERADTGRSAVLRYALRRPRTPDRIELPRGAGHEPGDATVAPNGDLFVSDGRAGVVYVVRDGQLALDTLVRAGPLVSPQGIAVDRDGHRLFVADWLLGIAIVDRESGRVSWLAHPNDVMVNGVDGMTMAGDTLIAVQNGVTPDRVAAFDLDASHTRIVRARVLARDVVRVREPTHVTVGPGGAVYFVVNGGFDAYDEAGALRAGVEQRAPVIGRVRR